MRTTRRPARYLLEQDPAARIVEIVGDGTDDHPGLLYDTERTLTDDEIGALEAELRDLFASVRAGDIEGIDRTDVVVLRRIQEGVVNLGAAAAVREQEDAQLQSELDEIEAGMDPIASAEGGDGENGDGENDDEGAEGDTAGEGEGEGTTTVEGEGDGEGTEGEGAEGDGQEAIAASGTTRPPLGSVAARQNRAQRRAAERARGQEAGATQTVGRVRLLGRGGSEVTQAQVAQDMIDGWYGSAPGSGKNIAARVITEYPPERVLGTDPQRNAELVEAVCADAMNPDRWSDDLVAAGGFCAPAVPTYDFVLQAVADRPVKASLPQFQGDTSRMRVTIPVSPTLSVIETTMEHPPAEGAAVSVWNETDDISALDGDPTKPFQRIDCADSDPFEMYAVVKRLRFGNFGARAWPELVQHWNGLTLAAQARVGETLLLNALKASMNQVTLGETFGAARDIIEGLIRAGAFMRSAERTGGQARLRAWLPEWVVDLMQADLLRTHRDDPENMLQARSVITSMLANANINPTYYIDSPTSGTTQLLRKQTNATALAPWPCDVQIGLAFEGTRLFMGGDTLNMGTYRDTNTNDVNDFETMSETFEGFAVRGGPEANWITASVQANGTYAAAIEAPDDLCGS